MPFVHADIQKPWYTRLFGSYSNVVAGTAITTGLFTFLGCYYLKIKPLQKQVAQKNAIIADSNGIIVSLDNNNLQLGQKVEAANRTLNIINKFHEDKYAALTAQCAQARIQLKDYSLTQEQTNQRCNLKITTEKCDAEIAKNSATINILKQRISSLNNSGTL